MKDSSKNEVSEALRKVYEQYSQYDSEQISKDAIEKYGKKAFVKRYERMFEAIGES